MSDTATKDPKAEGHDWVKSVLNLDVEALRQAKAGPDAGTGTKRAQSHHDAPAPDPDRAKRDAFDKEIEPRRAALKQSLGRTAKLKDVVADVRVAENAASEADRDAQAAADKGQWDQTAALLKKFDAAMKTLADTYTAAANELDARIGRRLTKLERLVESLEGTKLDATEAKKARDEVSLAEAKANQSPAGDVRLAALYGALAVADKAAIDSAGKLKTKGNQGAIAGLDAFRKSASDSIAKVTDTKKKAELDKRLVDWDKVHDAVIAQADLDKQKTQLADAEKQIRKLMADAAAAAGENASAKEQEAFKDAIKKRFGITIKVPPGMTNTHFEKFYDMMDLLPVQHTSQDQLQKLVYDADKSNTGAAFGSATVTMGNYGAEDWNYQDPKTGAPEKLNGFSISTLHEIGHSVDEKYKVMSTSNMAKDGFGGWTDKIKLAVIVKLFMDDFTGGVGKDSKIPEAMLRQLVITALTKGAVVDPTTKESKVSAMGDSDKPANLEKADWTKLKPTLDKCVRIRSDNWPWGKGRAVAFNGQAYHEAYDGEWVSYSVAARGKGEVRDYQWRSPAEWFAELYAYSWFKKEKPPNHIDEGAAKYMYSAKT